MFRGTRTPDLDLRTTLSSLPVTHLVFVLDGAWLVVGPTGLFVLTADTDLHAACEQAVSQAAAVRSRLAGELAWVPFVDALVLGDGRGIEGLTAPVIPAELLRSTIVDGPQTVDDETLAQLARIGLRRLH